jgi:hypothetical protein
MLMRTLRRFVLLVLFGFWQGGFLFYAAVVVPIGTAELGSPLSQGFITRRVTDGLNEAGLVALIPLAWDCLAARDALRWRRWARIALLLLLLLTLLELFHLHAALDALLDPVNRTLDDRRAFRPLHRMYLWVQTVQWGAGLVFLLLSLSAWRGEDGMTRTQAS